MESLIAWTLWPSDCPLGRAFSYPLPDAASQMVRCFQNTLLNTQMMLERIGVKDSR